MLNFTSSTEKAVTTNIRHHFLAMNSDFWTVTLVLVRTVFSKSTRSCGADTCLSCGGVVTITLSRCFAVGNGGAVVQGERK